MLVAALIGMDHNHWFKWKETSTLEVPCTTPLKIDFAQSLPNSAKISINIGLSYAVDMMYADHMNDHIYGLMVPRDANGNLV
jgi:hypothetical protein